MPVRCVFDDANLVSAAGLVPALGLAQAAGLNELLETQLSVDSPNRAAKTTSVIGGMLAGADCIDDLDLLRHGGMGRLFRLVQHPGAVAVAAVEGVVDDFHAEASGAVSRWVLGCSPRVKA